MSEIQSPNAPAKHDDPEARADAARAQALAEMPDAGPAPAQAQPEKAKGGMPPGVKKAILFLGGAIAVVVVITVLAIILALTRPDAAELIAAIRDIFIIFLAWFSILIAVSIVILILQMATLVNLLKNEIIPILENFQRTANTVRGTTSFMSEHLARPVIRATGFFTYIRTFFRYLGIIAGAELNEHSFPEDAPDSKVKKTSTEENAS
ncbi:MAG: hypothetical protein JXB47_20100 [Anaerolineae bacterium]|nr:hypothetical protein [Anaerolineae bacterium]